MLALKNFPGLRAVVMLQQQAQLWRLFIDHEFQSIHAWESLEKPIYQKTISSADTTSGDTYVLSKEPSANRVSHGEPGFCQAMLSSFVECLRQLGSPMTIDGIGYFHKRAVSKVEGTLYKTEKHKATAAGQYRRYYESAFFLLPGSYSNNGINELLQNLLELSTSKASTSAEFFFRKFETKDGAIIKHIVNAETIQSYLAKFDNKMDDLIHWLTTDSASETFSYHTWNNNIRTPRPAYLDPLVADKTQKIIDQYYNELTTYNKKTKHVEASTSDLDYDTERLKIIIRFSKRFALLHPFDDGNGRVGYLLLQKLLLENQFPPAIMDNPTLFACHTEDELVEIIKAGWQNTAYYLENLPAPEDIMTNEQLSTYQKLEEITGITSFFTRLNALLAAPDETDTSHATATSFYVATTESSTEMSTTKIASGAGSDRHIPWP